MKNLWMPASAMLLALTMSACQNTVNRIENEEKNAAPKIIKSSRFLTDSFLEDRLQLQSVRTSRDPSGNLQVEVSAINKRTGVLSEFWSWLTRENPYPVEYKFEWQDQNGMTVTSHVSGIWQRVTIRPGETVFFRAVAPTKDCKDFTLSVKEIN